MAGHQLGQAAHYSVCTDEAHQPTGSGPLPSESHCQVRGRLPEGRMLAEAVGREASRSAATFMSQQCPRPHLFLPPWRRGRMVAHSTYSLLSLRFQDTHSRPTALFQLLRVSGYQLPHPALMWYLLPTLQEAQEVDGTGPSVRNKSETFDRVRAAALAHLSLSSAAFSASSSFCRAVARRSWARSNSSSTS